MLTGPSVLKAEFLWDKSTPWGSSGVVISDVRKLLTEPKHTNHYRAVEGTWHMKSSRLPHLKPKWSSEEYILGKKEKKKNTFKEFQNISKINRKLR